MRKSFQDDKRFFFLWGLISSLSLFSFQSAFPNDVHLNDLPVEILEMILKKADPPTRVKANRVCRKWQSASQFNNDFPAIRAQAILMDTLGAPVDPRPFSLRKEMKKLTLATKDRISHFRSNRHSPQVKPGASAKITPEKLIEIISGLKAREYFRRDIIPAEEQSRLEPLCLKIMESAASLWDIRRVERHYRETVEGVVNEIHLLGYLGSLPVVSSRTVELILERLDFLSQYAVMLSDSIGIFPHVFIRIMKNPTLEADLLNKIYKKIQDSKQTIPPWFLNTPIRYEIKTLLLSHPNIGAELFHTLNRHTERDVESARYIGSIPHVLYGENDFSQFMFHIQDDGATLGSAAASDVLLKALATYSGSELESEILFQLMDSVFERRSFYSLALNSSIPLEKQKEFLGRVAVGAKPAFLAGLAGNPNLDKPLREFVFSFGLQEKNSLVLRNLAENSTTPSSLLLSILEWAESQGDPFRRLSIWAGLARNRQLPLGIQSILIQKIKFFMQNEGHLIKNKTPSGNYSINHEWEALTLNNAREEVCRFNSCLSARDIDGLLGRVLIEMARNPKTDSSILEDLLDFGTVFLGSRLLFPFVASNPNSTRIMREKILKEAKLNHDLSLISAIASWY